VKVGDSNILLVQFLGLLELPLSQRLGTKADSFAVVAWPKGLLRDLVQNIIREEAILFENMTCELFAFAGERKIKTASV